MIKIYMGPDCESRITEVTPKAMVFPEARKFPRTHRDIVDYLIHLQSENGDISVFTHSEMIVHYLRLAICKDPKLSAKIKGIWCLGGVNIEFGFSAEDESKWPVGFLTEAWEVEAEIRTIRDECRGTENARD